MFKLIEKSFAENNILENSICKKSPIEYIMYGANLQFEEDKGVVHGWQKNWRVNNPKKMYAQKRRAEGRYYNETIMFAENHRMRWDDSDLEYMRQIASIRTAREIAIDLGRTYRAVIVKASKEHIPLMTDAKRHGEVVT